MGRMSQPELSPEALRRVCDFLYRRTGMSYGEAKRYYIERRVTDRMQRAGTRTNPAYMQRLEA
jgi:chemotaxis protein methyltransferase CheR